MSTLYTHQRPRLSQLASAKKLRSKLTLSQLLRPAPPERNDTPFNFTEILVRQPQDDRHNEAAEDEEDEDEDEDERGRISRNRRQGYHIRSNSGRENITPYSLERRPQSHLRRIVWKMSRSVRKERPDVERAAFKLYSEASRATSGRDKRLPSSNRRKSFGNILVNGSGFMRRGSDVKSAHGKIDFVHILPTELTAGIFSYLDRQSLAACERVSTAWYESASSSHTWRHVFAKEYGSWMKIAPGKDWKKIFEAKQAIDARWEKGTATPTYLKGHSDSVYCLQHDQEKIFTGSRDRTIRVWNIQKAECVKVIGLNRADFQESQSQSASQHPLVEYHTGSILCLQFDTEILVSGSSDHTCIIYSISNYQPIKTLRGHRLGVLDVCFDKTHIVSCSKDTTLIVWDRTTGLLLHRLSGHSGPVNSVQLRGDYAVSASGDADIKLWNIQSGTLIKDFKGHTRGLACVHEDCRTIVSAGNDLSIRVWDVATGKLRYKIMDAHISLIRTLHLDSHNERIISGSYDQCVREQVKVWCLRTGKALLNFPRWHGSYILAAKSDYRRIISTSQDSQVLILDFSAGLNNMELLL